MKICYLANTGMPSTNASAIQIVKMCEAFSKLKNHVILITTNVSSGNIFDFYNIKTKFEFKKIKSFNKFPLGFKFYLFSMNVYLSMYINCLVNLQIFFKFVKSFIFGAF